MMSLGKKNGLLSTVNRQVAVHTERLTLQRLDFCLQVLDLDLAHLLLIAKDADLFGKSGNLGTLPIDIRFKPHDSGGRARTGP